MKEPLTLGDLVSEMSDVTENQYDYIVFIDDRDDEWTAVEIKWDHPNRRIVIGA